MFYENIDDHNRSGRGVALRNAANLLRSLEKNAVIFVEGDNNTFPLWYAQEVEGIRKDVKVLNLSYLTSPKYVAASLRSWDGAPALKSVFKEADIIFNAFTFPKLDENASGTAPAVSALEKMLDSGDATFQVTCVELPIGEGDTVTLPLRKLSRNGYSNSLEFRKVMMLDLIASNAVGENPRPFYWLRGLAGHAFAGLRDYVSESLFAYRLGRLPGERVDSMIIEAARKVEAPNFSPDAYMDETPAFQVARQRASLTIAARRLLRRGHHAEAERIARKALRNMGYDHNTFASVAVADTAFRTGREFGLLFKEIADSTGNAEMRALGISLLRRDSAKREGWRHYRRALPPALRGKMSTTH